MSNYDYDYEDYDFEDPDLKKHKKCDQIKWILTAVAFVLVFVLIGGLFIALCRPNGSEKEKEPEPTVKIQTRILSFDDTEKRTSFSELKQVWEDNGITFTNLKGSGSNVGDYHNPVRLYTHSTVMVECDNMTRIVFYCIGATHVGNLRDSLDEEGITVSVNNNDVTLTFEDAVDELEITDLIGQVQLSQIAVTAAFPVSPDDEKLPEEDDTGVVDDEGHSMEKDVVYAMPTAMTFSEEKLVQALAASTTVDVKVSVNVYPVDAADKSVDFSVAWGAAPMNGKNAVTDYLTVKPDSDGSTSATVSCKKAFGNDQIIITATTRDGGFTATCTVTFVGRASAMSITSSTLTAKSNSGRGTYYELGTNRTYTFNINLSNVFNSVGSKNLSVKLGGSGSLYFGTMTVNGMSGISTFQNMVKKDVSTLVNTFITSATISGTTLTIQTGKTYIENYYSSNREDLDSWTSYYYDRYVYPDDGYGLTNGTNYSTNAKANESALPSCYFTVTVSDSVSGLSQTIKLWVVSAVSSVSFSQKTLNF